MPQWDLIIDPLMDSVIIVFFFHCVTLCPFYFCNHLDGVERELVAFLFLSSWCLTVVVWRFFTVSQACLQFVIVAVPDHTHYFYLTIYEVCNGFNCGVFVSFNSLIEILSAPVAFSD